MQLEGGCLYNFGEENCWTFEALSLNEADKIYFSRDKIKELGQDYRI
jgi:hypothetical protein